MSEKYSFDQQSSNILNTAVTEAYQLIDKAFDNQDFSKQMNNLFGNSEELQAIIDNLKTQNDLHVPHFQIVADADMGGALAAYSSEYESIFVSDSLLVGDQDVLTGALIEEIGHHIDNIVNFGVDTQGDEGELFAAAVQGIKLNDVDTSLINVETDLGVVNVNGSEVVVEQLKKPTISVQAVDNMLNETNDNSQFVFTRTGNTTKELTVEYKISGTATNGVDYTELSGKIIFAKGSSTAVLDVVGIDDSLAESDETVKVKIKQSDKYNRSSNKKATATIYDPEDDYLAPLNPSEVSTAQAFDILELRGQTDYGTNANALSSWGYDIFEITQTLYDKTQSASETTLELRDIFDSNGQRLSYTEIFGALNVLSDDVTSPRYSFENIRAQALRYAGASMVEIGNVLLSYYPQNSASGNASVAVGILDNDNFSAFNSKEIAQAISLSDIQASNFTAARILYNRGAEIADVYKGLNAGVGFSIDSITLAIANQLSYVILDEIAFGLYNAFASLSVEDVKSYLLSYPGVTSDQIESATLLLPGSPKSIDAEPYPIAPAGVVLL
jgi:hypothetical protein